MCSLTLKKTIRRSKQHLTIYQSILSVISFYSCFIQFSSSFVSDSATPWTAARQAYLPITNSRSLLKLISIEWVMPSKHLILCRPLLLLPSVFPNIRVFSTESVLRIRWPKFWSFSFSISLSSEYSGLISFRFDWFNLLAVQGTFKRLPQTPQFISILLLQMRTLRPLVGY